MDTLVLHVLGSFQPALYCQQNVVTYLK